MRIIRPVVYLLPLTLLLACKPATESTETATATAEQAPAASALPVRYSAIDLANLGDAEAMTTLCEQENQSMREHFAVLEGFTGVATINGYYKSLDSLNSSLGNMSFAAQSLAAVHPDPDFRTAAEACAQLLSEIGTDLSLSRPIYDAVSSLDTANEDQATKHSVEKAILGFRLAGVDKDEATRARIRELNKELVTLGQTFDRNIRDDVRTLELDSVDQLAGLPEDYIAAHQPGEDGKIRVTTQYPDLFPFITYSESDELRKELLTLRGNRAYPANKEVLESLMAKRYELAQLVGFNNYAELITADKMVGSPKRVSDFLAELKEYTAEANDRDYNMLLERLRQDSPDAERVEAWQSTYVAEKVRSEKFQVDSKEIRQYFNYDNSRDGILTMIQDLFQIQIRPWETATWHEDVEAYELVQDDKVLGRFYLDMHPRDGKFGHAAMFPFVNGIEDVQLPVAGLICNFPSGTDLMQHSQVITFLHEFGHLIHWMFAGHQPWSNVSGIATEWDFVEAPSQMLEEWVWDYDTVSRFARNADGEPIPEDLLNKMIAARDFGLGAGTRRQLSLAAMSLNIYNQDPASVDLDEMVPRMSREYTHYEPIPGTHFYTNFGHLNGYSAIYYTYQWSKAIATDMFTRFEEQGLRNVEVAGAYRDIVLAGGGTRPAAELVTEFLGRDISFKPYADRLSGKK
ncbi:MAG: Zn-dependent oligopeptidase [Xanthomonadales bacterium]|nr:Zn-dependent oligopeptidase [Xanthomonadales bacterium]